MINDQLVDGSGVTCNSTAAQWSWYLMGLGKKGRRTKGVPDGGGGGFFLRARILEECSTNHSPPASFFFFFFLKWRLAGAR